MDKITYRKTNFYALIRILFMFLEAVGLGYSLYWVSVVPYLDIAENRIGQMSTLTLVVLIFTIFVCWYLHRLMAQFAQKIGLRQSGNPTNGMMTVLLLFYGGSIWVSQLIACEDEAAKIVLLVMLFCCYLLAVLGGILSFSIHSGWAEKFGKYLEDGPPSGKHEQKK